MNDIPLQSMSKTRKSLSHSENILNNIINKYDVFPSSNKTRHDAASYRSGIHGSKNKNNNNNSSGSNGEGERIITFYTNLISCFYMRVMKARRRDR